MVNIKLFRSKLMTIPGMFKRQWHQLTHQSSLIRVQNASELFPNIYDNEVLLGKLDRRFGDLCSIHRLAFLCLLAKALDAKVVFEFGTFRGRTTYNLALNLPDDGLLYTIDLGQDVDRSNVQKKGYGSYVVGECLQSASDKIRNKVVQYCCDSRNFNFDHLVNAVDLIFVDGGHNYDVLCSDNNNALRMRRPGGVIVWDDYSPYLPDVERVLDELGMKMCLHHLPIEGLVISKQ